MYAKASEALRLQGPWPRFSGCSVTALTKPDRLSGAAISTNCTSTQQVISCPMPGNLAISRPWARLGSTREWVNTFPFQGIQRVDLAGRGINTLLCCNDSIGLQAQHRVQSWHGIRRHGLPPHCSVWNAAKIGNMHPQHTVIHQKRSANTKLVAKMKT